MFQIISCLSNTGSPQPTRKENWNGKIKLEEQKTLGQKNKGCILPPQKEQSRNPFYKCKNSRKPYTCTNLYKHTCWCHRYPPVWYRVPVSEYSASTLSTTFNEMTCKAGKTSGIQTTKYSVKPSITNPA